jgi:uncharacterized protein (TIGR03066 family)
MEMNAIKLLGLGAAMVLLSAGTRAQEKTDYAKLIVGKWEATKADEGTIPVGTLVEFTKDGKMKVAAKKGGMEQTVEGTYKVEKDTFTFKLNVNGQEVMQTITITKINEKEMATKDKDGKTVEMKKTK